MCTRYYVELSPELRPIIEAARSSSLTDKMIHHLARPFKEEGEIRPTDIAAVIAPNSRGKQAVFPMIWGFTMPEIPNTRRSGPLVNARVETADFRPAFKESWYRRRCIVPASWYFEWQHFTSPNGSRKTGDKYMIQSKNSTLCCLAGLYRMENGYPHFTILTRDASEDLQPIHDRMPVILHPDQIPEWIHPSTLIETVKKIAADSLTEMVCEKA